MKKYFKEFMIRGMMFGGFGPIIFALILFFIWKYAPDTQFNGDKILLGTISIYILAFVHAGASVFNQIDEWGINKSIGIHFSTLYVAYSVCYLINRWIPFDPKVFGIFSAIFVGVYAIVWLVVYLCVKRTSHIIVDGLKNNQK